MAWGISKIQKSVIMSRMHPFDELQGPLWIPLSHIGSKVKRRQSQSHKFKKTPKFQIFEFWNGHYKRHTFWSCLIRCANMKWIRWVFLKIQSGHDSVHRRTDGRTDGRTVGQTDKVIPVYPPINFVEGGGYNERLLWSITICWPMDGRTTPHYGMIHFSQVYKNTMHLDVSLSIHNLGGVSM